jgi:hypothetical protein
MSCPHTTDFDDRSWTAPQPDSKDDCGDCAAMGVTVWGTSTDVPDVRPRRLLRLQPAPPRDEHHDETGHPVMRSFEPGEQWRWCYVDQRVV